MANAQKKKKNIIICFTSLKWYNSNNIKFEVFVDTNTKNMPININTAPPVVNKKK